MKLSCYRYQLCVDKSFLFINDPNVNKFQNAENLAAHKGQIFIDSLNQTIADLNNNENCDYKAALVTEKPYKGLFFYRIGRKHIINIKEDVIGESKQIESWDYVVNLFIDTDSNTQIIAVEEDKINFSQLEKILFNPIKEKLRELIINLHIIPLINEKDFWIFVREHSDSISLLEATIFAPNMSAANQRVAQMMSDLRANSNAQKATLKLETDNGSLRISKDDPNIQSIVAIVSTGLGSVTVKTTDKETNVKNKTIFKSDKNAQPIIVNMHNKLDTLTQQNQEHIDRKQLELELEELLQKLRKYSQK